jgi:hypothetical protein
MSRFQPSNPSQYGFEMPDLSADQWSQLIDAGAGVVNTVASVLPDKKKKPAKKGGGKKKAPAPAARPHQSSYNPQPPAEKKSNTALYIGGGVAALLAVGGIIWAVRR